MIYLLNDRNCDLSGSQYRVRDVFVAMSIFCFVLAISVAAWRRQIVPSAIEFYAMWTLTVICNYWFARSTSLFGQSENMDYAQAYRASWATGRIQQWAWGLISAALLVGLAFFGADVSSILRLFVAPLMLFVPICVFANLLSLAIVCDLHDFRFIAYRLTSIAATLVPVAWVLVESNR
jgi:hypothetical protein